MIRRTHENYILLGHGFEDTVTNYSWNVEGDDGWENDLTLQMELFMEAIKFMEPSRTVFLDIGVNIGTHMLHLASRGYETHGFEPNYANYILTHCALAISKLTGLIRFNHFGLGDKVRSVCMDTDTWIWDSVTTWNMGDSRVNTEEHCDPTQQATLDTLDNYYDKFLHGRKVALLKIDIQGSEIAALMHGTKLFDSSNAPEVVVLEYEPHLLRKLGADPPDLIRYFESRDYSIWHIGPKPAGKAAPDFLNGTSVPWRESDISALESFERGSYDLIAIKKAWKSSAEKAGYQFVGGTVQKTIVDS
jgi:FkbM family methyltransferase